MLKMLKKMKKGKGGEEAPPDHRLRRQARKDKDKGEIENLLVEVLEAHEELHRARLELEEALVEGRMSLSTARYQMSVTSSSALAGQQRISATMVQCSDQLIADVRLHAEPGSRPMGWSIRTNTSASDRKRLRWFAAFPPPALRNAQTQ